MKYTWWILQIVLCGVGIFFLIFGIDLLRASYALNNPFSFIMSFFAASFVILISGTLIVAFIFKMVRVYNAYKKSDSDA